jgi:hypothetical protein
VERCACRGCHAGDLADFRSGLLQTSSVLCLFRSGQCPSAAFGTVITGQYRCRNQAGRDLIARARSRSITRRHRA